MATERVCCSKAREHRDGPRTAWGWVSRRGQSPSLSVALAGPESSTDLKSLAASHRKLCGAQKTCVLSPLLNSCFDQLHLTYKTLCQEVSMPAKSSRSSNARSRSQSNRRSKRRWVAGVKTVSTFPPEGLFTKDAATIAVRWLQRRCLRKVPARACACSPTSSTARAAALALPAGSNLRRPSGFSPSAFKNKKKGLARRRREAE